MDKGRGKRVWRGVVLAVYAIQVTGIEELSCWIWPGSAIYPQAVSQLVYNITAIPQKDIQCHHEVLDVSGFILNVQQFLTSMYNVTTMISNSDAL